MLTKEEAKERIKQLVKDFKEGEKYWSSKPEEDIKFQFIEPLFEALGWERKEISKEPRVLKGRADYILRIGNKEVLVIEAKKTNVTLMEEEGRQAVSYAYHRKIKFAVLTNFKSIRVYHALSNIKNIDKNLLKKDNAYFILKAEEFLDKFDLLWLLSKESFEKQEINKLLSVKDERINKPIDESILNDLLESRELLSKDLKKFRTQLTKEQIDEIVQILINRLIFMRSAEDRGLEPMNLLFKICEDVRLGRTDKNLWSELKSQFRIFDKQYDSKLFEEGILEKEGFFDDKTLVGVIRALYFGTKEMQARYMFDEIPGDLLGNIYEQYLGVILSGTEKRVKLEEESGKRKKMGIYYTPSYIVDYIVKNTVGEYIKDKSIDEILDVKIVDPACGSGSFLIRAFQELCNFIEEKLKKGEKAKNAQFQFYKNDKLSLGQKASIMQNCIYGVDLDEKAVELAQLNLLLKLLEEETPESHKRLLPNLRENIKNGNSLIDDSKISDYAFKWEAQFPHVFKSGGFDIVIGNPPYFNMQTTGENIQKYFELSERWGEYYRGQSDILYYFYIQGIKLLKDNGELGFITSRYWLENKWADKLRRFILNNASIKKIIDFRENYIFGDAGVHTGILFLNHNKNKENKIKFYNFIDKISIYEDLDKIVLSEISQKDLSEDIWVFTSKESGSLIERLRKDSELLNKIAFIGKGYDTGLNEVFEITEEIINKYKIEKELLVKDIKNGDIKRYFIDWRGLYLIYLTKDKNINHFPKTLAYLSNFKNKLIERYAYKNKQCAWFSLSTLRNKNLFDNSKIKIVVPYMADKNNFALDELGYYNGGAEVFIIVSKDEDKFKSRFLLGLLNSKPLTYFVHIVGKKKGGTFRYSTTYLNDIPIRLPSPSQEKKIVDLVNQMLEIQQKYHKENISGNEKDRLKQQMDNIDYEINQEVYKLYELTLEEIKIVEESLK